MFNKRLVLSFVVLFVVFSTVGNVKRGVILSTDFVRENIFLPTSIFYFDSRDKDNLPQPNDVLCLLFVETIYEKFVKDELPTFKVITDILSRPFVNFWIVKDVINFVLRSVHYIINETKKFTFVTKVVCTVSAFLPFVLLTYFKTHLKTRRLAPMVLRC